MNRVAFIGLFVVTLLLESCISMNISSQIDKTNNFSQYKTFAWVHRAKNHHHADPKIDNDIVENNIISYVNLELGARGYQIDTLNPDVLLDYDIITQNKTSQQQQPIYQTTYAFNRPYYYNTYNPYRSYSNMGYSSTIYNNGYSVVPYNTFYYNSIPTTYIAGYQTINVNYEDGTVTIFMLDKKQNRLVWQGSAEGSVDDVESFEWELPKDIGAIFKRYPIKPIKKKN